MDKQAAVYDSTISAREYISYIAESAGGFACIGRDGKLYIKTIGQYTANIDLKLFQNFKWGEQFIVSCVAYEDGTRSFKYGNTNKNTLWINTDNMYVVDTTQIQNIYNQMKNFECYSFEGSSIIDPALDIGDIIIIDNKKVIYQGDLEYSSKFKANIKSKIQVKAKEETTRTNLSNKTKIRRIQSQINQIDGAITQIAEEQDEQATIIAQHTVSIGEVSQEVSKKVGNDEFSTKLKTDWESVQIAWNTISEFIKFVNAQLQIKDNSQNLLMTLDRIGQHFYRTDGNTLIGTIGRIDNENQIAFAINGDTSGNSMVWGIYRTVNGTKTFFPVFKYGGYNTSASASEFGGNFYMEAPLLMQENRIYLGQDEYGAYVEGIENGNVNINTDAGFSVSKGSAELINETEDNVQIYFNNSLLLGSGIGEDWLEIKMVGGVPTVDLGNTELYASNVPYSWDVYKFTATANTLLMCYLNGGGTVSLHTTSSDKRLKKEIKNSDINALEIIKKMKHRMFKWRNNNKQENIGYIAQELEEIDSNYIYKTEIQKEDGTTDYDYQVNVLSVLSTATKAIQEQQEIIKNQTKVIKEQQEIIKNLTKRIEKLEAIK